VKKANPGLALFVRRDQHIEFLALSHQVRAFDTVLEEQHIIGVVGADEILCFS
jgi:hypothetical protein